MSNNTLFQRYSTFFFILFCIPLFLFFIGESAHADHLPAIPGVTESVPPILFSGPLNNTNWQPCRVVDVEDRPIRVIQGNPGSGQGEVPVYDNDASRNLVILIDALQREAQYTELQDGDIQRTAEYLRLLCEKEYEEDHVLQHAWASLIGEFVQETRDFVSRGLQGNPAFLTNQNAYYQIVSIATARVFMQDIVNSNMGAPTKREIVRGVTRSLFSEKFPYTGAVLMADPDVPDQLSADGVNYVADVYWGEFLDHIQDPDARNDAVQRQALTELQKRTSEQIAREQEKLAWGRGFFSYEVCDLAAYLGIDTSNPRDGIPDAPNPEDRRNCRIATPGSLIQDQVSFVFGSALRQMEINDEYEEWIAPNTLAVLSDVLTDRSLNDSPISREQQYANQTNAASPTTLGNIDLEAFSVARENASAATGRPSGTLPFEFGTAIDWSLTPGSTTSSGLIGIFGNQLGNIFFQNVLDPAFFINQIP